MNKKIIVSVLLSVLMLFCSVGVVALADEEQEESPWYFLHDFGTKSIEWIYDYLKYGSRFDDKYGENGGHGGGGYHRSIENGIKDSVQYDSDTGEIQQFNVNGCYSITGKFVVTTESGNKILYQVSFNSYDYALPLLSPVPAAGSDLWDKGGEIILDKVDMNTGLSVSYSFPALLRGGSSAGITVLDNVSRSGVPAVLRVNFFYKDNNTVKSGSIYFGQTDTNTIQIYNLSDLGYYEDDSTYSNLFSSSGSSLWVTRSNGGHSTLPICFVLSSFDTNDNNLGSSIVQKYFGGNFGLAPVFVDTTYSSGSVYNVNNIAPELGFNYINGQLELDADILGAKIDLVLDHLLDLYNDFYSNQTAPYTSINEGDTYNYIEIIQEPEEPVTYPVVTGQGGGVPDEWLQHYPPIDTTPYIVADVPNLSYFEDNAVIPPASVTLFEMMSDFVVDGGFLGLFSITFVLGISMYFFRR